MPRIDQHTIATKVIGVSGAQSLLREMALEPERVSALVLTQAGDVFVHLDENPRGEYLGRIKDDYWQYFGKPISQWKVTGGHQRPAVSSYVDGDGHLHERLAYYGLNITVHD